MKKIICSEWPPIKVNQYLGRIFKHLQLQFRYPYLFLRWNGSYQLRKRERKNEREKRDVIHHVTSENHSRCHFHVHIDVNEASGSGKKKSPSSLRLPLGPEVVAGDDSIRSIKDETQRSGLLRWKFNIDAVSWKFPCVLPRHQQTRTKFSSRYWFS